MKICNPRKPTKLTLIEDLLELRSILSYLDGVLHFRFDGQGHVEELDALLEIFFVIQD